MANPFLAEIRMFGFNFPPTGWATCDGQILSLSQNTALFSLLGTNFGGNGTTNFGLPNLQGSVPLDAGQGKSLSPYVVGQTGGSASVVLTQNQMASHPHTVQAREAQALTGNPAPAPTEVFAKSIGGEAYATPSNLVAFAPTAISPTGGSQAHNNLMPYLVVNFCIALTGIYPPRS